MTEAQVKTLSITIYTPDGKRLGYTKKGKVRWWTKHPDTASNLRQAITYAKATLNKHMGTIVYVGTVPVYHCKWNPGITFYGWKSNPVAGMWRKKLPNV